MRFLTFIQKAISAVFLLTLTCVFTDSAGQDFLEDKKKFFLQNENIDMKLVADFARLRRDKGSREEDLEYIPARVTVFLKDSVKITAEAEIRARGEFRREQCHMPPIMVNFRTAGGESLKKLGRLKLVWPCSSREYDQQLVFREYLVYKMYNLITEKSFRVRMAKVAYSDINNKIKPGMVWAFFIEDVDDMAKRNNCREVDLGRFHTESTDRDQMTLVSIFQYMIGNTDWSVPVYQNIKLIRSRKDSMSPPFAVPYDFDYCGLVNASYAIPPPELNLRSVKERLYRGFPRTLAELEKALDIFKKKRQEMYSLVHDCVQLDNHYKIEMIKYLDEFFKLIEKEKNIEAIFIDKARRE